MANRKMSTVETTKDRVAIITVDFACEGAGAGSETVTGSLRAAPTGSIKNSTDQTMVTGSTTTHQINFISGTNGAVKTLTITFPSDNRYRQLLGGPTVGIRSHSDAPPYQLRILSASGDGATVGFFLPSIAKSELTDAASGSISAFPVTREGVTGSLTWVVRNSDRNT